MAINVLRKPGSIFPIEITCKHCGSLLEVESASDLVIMWEDEDPKVAYLDCPWCDNRMPLYEADQAQAIKEFYSR